MKTIVENLEREGGHILTLLVVMFVAMILTQFTIKPTVESLCHDIAVGAFSAALALLKGNGKRREETKPDPDAPPTTT